MIKSFMQCFLQVSLLITCKGRHNLCMNLASFDRILLDRLSRNIKTATNLSTVYYGKVHNDAHFYLIFFFFLFFERPFFSYSFSSFLFIKHYAKCIGKIPLFYVHFRIFLALFYSSNITLNAYGFY